MEAILEIARSNMNEWCKTFKQSWTTKCFPLSSTTTHCHNKPHESRSNNTLSLEGLSQTNLAYDRITCSLKLNLFFLLCVVYFGMRYRAYLVSNMAVEWNAHWLITNVKFTEHCSLLSLSIVQYSFISNYTQILKHSWSSVKYTKGLV